MSTFKSRYVHKAFMLQLLAYGVLFDGIEMLLGALSSHVTLNRHSITAHGLRITVPILGGITLVYLATLLKRRKEHAWYVTIGVYTFLLVVNLGSLLDARLDPEPSMANVIRSVALPICILFGLAYYHKEFTVKSDTQSFYQSLRFISLVLAITFSYGIIGFLLLDKRDFHEEISLLQASHYTVDQFGLTTAHQIMAVTYRGRVFLDSLSLVSIVSVGYALLSLFQPLRARFADQTAHRQQMQELLRYNPSSSEDFFKLWPHDKTYFFLDNFQAGLAYHVNRGVALSVGDPAGAQSHLPKLISAFEQQCRTNDWLPAFVHTSPVFTKLYKAHGFSLQKIGQAAIVDVDHFVREVAPGKYFRQIQNRFGKQGYSVELLQPPHHKAVLSRLREVSDDWLALPGKSERGFMMGYFSEEYLEVGPLLVMRDAAGSIQGFINQIPSYDPGEANFDFLRYSKHAPGNTNDFLLMNFIRLLQESGTKRLNLGLSPLAGFDQPTDDRTVLDSLFSFVYSNGDRLYSFSGLHRFKTKYEPSWEDRYIAYKKGLRGITRTAQALNRTMNHVPKSTKLKRG